MKEIVSIFLLGNPLDTLGRTVGCSVKCQPFSMYPGRSSQSALLGMVYETSLDIYI